MEYADIIKIGGTVDSCTNHSGVKISGVARCGGIVGGNYGTVKNCTNETVQANITGQLQNGIKGICGYDLGTTTNCTGDFGN